mmetsp:Transcript_48628/g.118454  ORF Transcript_48628/g.118454 Transcript_48628/m.118454 type:complete len:85 (+) Transcript_48628:74-328(+)
MADDEAPPAKATGPAAEKKSQKLEASFSKAVGGKLKLKGSIDKSEKSSKKSKKGVQTVEVNSSTRESQLDQRVKKKSDRFCMHT